MKKEKEREGKKKREGKEKRDQMMGGGTRKQQEKTIHHNLDLGLHFGSKKD